MQGSKEYYKDQYLEMWIEDGILFIIYEKGLVIDLAVAKAVLEARLKLIADRLYPCFADCRGVKYWSKEARVFQATKENNIGMTGAAMLVETHAHKIISQFYLFFNKPTVPQACFTDKTEAIKWLQKYRRV